MWLFGLDVPLWLFLFLVICILLYWHGTKTFKTFEILGIPYRKPLVPFFGNLLERMSMSMATFDMKQRMLCPGRISGSFEGRQPILDIADANLYHQMCTKHFSKFTNRKDQIPDPATRSIVFALDDHWKHLRRITTSVIAPAKQKVMFSNIYECGDRLVAHMKKSAGSPIIIKKYAAGYSAAVIASSVFGLDIVDIQSGTDHPFVVNASILLGAMTRPGWGYKFYQFVCMMVVFVIPSFVTKLVLRPFGFSIVDHEALRFLTAILNDLFESNMGTDTSHKEQKNIGEMLAEKLVNLKDVDKSTIRVSADGTVWTTAGLTKPECIASALNFIGAGFESTAAAIQFFCYHMALHPDIQEKVQATLFEINPSGEIGIEEIRKLEYLDWCVKESLRIFPPVFRIDRVCSEECTVEGIHIPKGTLVYASIYAIQHDPEYWPEPEKYNPERFSPENLTESHQYAFIPFGTGTRMCPASTLAMLQVKMAVIKLLTAFTFERVAGTPKPADVVFKNADILLQTANPLKISAIPRRK